jgi:hypothetical protein
MVILCQKLDNQLSKVSRTTNDCVFICHIAVEILADLRRVLLPSLISGRHRLPKEKIHLEDVLL